MKKNYIDPFLSFLYFLILQYAQVLMLRGMRKPWKFPLYFDFDTNLTLDFVKEIITRIEECGGLVRFCTGDMGNKTFLSQVGITKGNHFFQNPARIDAKVYVLCDPPHLIKVCLFHYRYKQN